MMIIRVGKLYRWVDDDLVNVRNSYEKLVGPGELFTVLEVFERSKNPMFHDCLVMVAGTGLISKLFIELIEERAEEVTCE
jgi:hypothetical protein